MKLRSGKTTGTYKPVPAVNAQGSKIFNTTFIYIIPPYVSNEIPRKAEDMKTRYLVSYDVETPQGTEKKYRLVWKRKFKENGKK